MCKNTKLTNVVGAVNEALLEIEANKSLYGLDDVAFDRLYIGDQVPTYTLQNDHYMKTDYELYPLYINNKLACFAIIRSKSDGYFAQIDASLSHLINNTINLEEEYALVYDRNSCYYITNSDAIKLVDHEPCLERSVFSIDTYKMDKNRNLNYCSVSPKQSIQYDADRNLNGLRSQIFLNVGFDILPATDHYCWACCVANIGNYLKQQNYSGYNIAYWYYGTNYNQGASLSVSMSVLNSFYSLNYYNTGTFAYYTIYNNLTNYYPLFVDCSVSGSTNGHAVVICGLILETGTLTVMDPNFSVGYISVYNNYGYSYVSSVSGNTIYLNVLGAAL